MMYCPVYPAAQSEFSQSLTRGASPGRSNWLIGSRTANTDAINKIARRDELKRGQLLWSVTQLSAPSTGTPGVGLGGGWFDEPATGKPP